jgi:hypothetical protein
LKQPALLRHVMLSFGCSDTDVVSILLVPPCRITTWQILMNVSETKTAEHDPRTIACIGS